MGVPFSDRGLTGRPRCATVTIVDAFSDKHVTGRGALLLEIQYLGGAGTGNSSTVVALQGSQEFPLPPIDVV
jgi:hypothetical protein